MFQQTVENLDKKSEKEMRTLQTKLGEGSFQIKESLKERINQISDGANKVGTNWVELMPTNLFDEYKTQNVRFNDKFSIWVRWYTRVDQFQQSKRKYLDADLKGDDFERSLGISFSEMNQTEIL